jgi:hypothetical protein
LFEGLYNRLIAVNIYKFGWFLYLYGDQGFFEYVGPNGFYNLVWFNYRSRLWLPSLYLEQFIYIGCVFILILFFL